MTLNAHLILYFIILIIVHVTIIFHKTRLKKHYLRSIIHSCLPKTSQDQPWYSNLNSPVDTKLTRVTRLRAGILWLLHRCSLIQSKTSSSSCLGYLCVFESPTLVSWPIGLEQSITALGRWCCHTGHRGSLQTLNSFFELVGKDG